ncbi:MAG: hypothetical protein VX154_08575 [Pseudomonadota bacterium]|nr:hypothetical protein [Pseudomonadota bacterium]
MGQISYVKETGEVLEAFSMSDNKWNEICALPIGSLIMPYTDWPAIPKTSIRGLRFFAHHQGYPEKLPKPKSYAHTRLQIDIVQIARKLGFKAEMEVRKPNTSNPKWIADTLITSHTGQRIAFEVQLSSQHLDDFIERTNRYTESNIKVCWVLAEKPVADRLCKALCYKNKDYYKKTKKYLADDERLLTLNLDIPNKDNYPEILPLFRFSRGLDNIKRLTLQDAIQGVIQELPRWEHPNWKWGND